MRPRALMMRIVISPQEVPDQIMLLREFEADRIVLERSGAVFAEILARQFFELRIGPHMMLAGGFVHRFERPRHPADSALDPREPELPEALQHPRSAQARDRLDRR